MFSEGINSQSPVYLRGTTAERAGPSSAEIKLKQSLESIRVEVADCHFRIWRRLFANRMVPAYLQKTKIESIDSFSSANHWRGLIFLWLRDKAVFLPHKISQAHLEIVHGALQKYMNALERIQSATIETCRGAAKEIIAEIQREVKGGKIFYTPLGYTGSEHERKGGHALTVKFCDKGDEIEVSFLNLGEGLQMHPHVDWSSEGARFHFQSFPVGISKSTFASQQCEDVFTRLVRLEVERCPLRVNHYSSEDVYGPISSLGTVKSSFSSPIADRSRKPQLNGICGDMAVLLLIKDILIDLGYTREEIHRFITLEKLSNILFFHHQLCQSEGTLDEWILLRNGLREFSVRALKDNETLLLKAEIEFLHNLLQPIFAESSQKIDQLKRIALPITSLQQTQDLTANALPKKIETPKADLFSLSFSEKSISGSVETPSLLSAPPTEIKAQLLSWVKIAKKLEKSGNQGKTHHFVYRALCSLEIPSPVGEGFWDHVPLEEIPEILEALAALAQLGMDRTEGELIYRNVLILGIGYTVTDRLVRKKYPQR